MTSSSARIRYELLLKGGNLSFTSGFFGLCNVVLVWADERTPLLWDEAPSLELLVR